MLSQASDVQLFRQMIVSSGQARGHQPQEEAYPVPTDPGLNTGEGVGMCAQGIIGVGPVKLGP